ncbi:MAG: hypothetical protein ABSF18_03205 [Gammaproteobacteria bacterium]
MNTDTLTFFIYVQQQSYVRNLTSDDFIISLGVRNINANLSLYNQEKQNLIEYVQSELDKQTYTSALEKVNTLKNIIETILATSATPIEEDIKRNIINLVKSDIFQIDLKQQDLDKYMDVIQDLDNPANTMFGIYVGAQLTFMLSSTVFPVFFGLTFSVAMLPAILIIIIFNVLFDKILYQIFAHLILSSEFLKKIFGSEFNVDSKEDFKFFVLVVAAIICFSLGVYYIPAALLIFSAAYFVNFYLQSGHLTKAIRKLFFSIDKETCERSLGIGYKYEKIKLSDTITVDIVLNQWELTLIKFASLFSIFFGVAMAALFAKWVFPVIISAAFFGSMVSPLGIVVIAGLVLYGIVYAILTASAWAELVQFNHAYQKQYGAEITFGYGVLSIHALVKLFNHIRDGFYNYYKEAKQTFSLRMRGMQLLFIKDKRLEGLGELFLGLTQFIIASISLIWRIFKLAICIIAPYGMWCALDKASLKLIDILQAFTSKEVATGLGAATTWINAIAKGPFIVKSALEQLANIFSDVSGNIENIAGTYVYKCWHILQVAVFGKELKFSHFIADLYRWSYGANGFLATNGEFHKDNDPSTVDPLKTTAFIGAFSQAITTAGKARNNFDQLTTAKPIVNSWDKKQEKSTQPQQSIASVVPSYFNR